MEIFRPEKKIPWDEYCCFSNGPSYGFGLISKIIAGKFSIIKERFLSYNNEEMKRIEGWVNEHKLMEVPLPEWPDELKVLFRMTF